MGIMATRGCPYNCNFCAWPQIMYGGRSYRVRNPISVVDELENLIENYGFKTYFNQYTSKLK